MENSNLESRIQLLEMKLSLIDKTILEYKKIMYGSYEEVCEETKKICAEISAEYMRKLLDEINQEREAAFDMAQKQCATVIEEFNKTWLQAKNGIADEILQQMQAKLSDGE